MHKIYNLIAELCSYVISSCTEDFFVKYSCISRSEKERIYALIDTHVTGLFSEDKTIVQLQQTDLTEGFLSSLYAFSKKIKKEKDFFAIVGLTQVLDDSLETVLRAQTAEFQKDDFSVVLNTNREATGIGLLPRCSCIWERKRRLSHYYNRMDNFLFNLLLMENTILGELIDKHFFLPQTLFPHFTERGALKIAATPLRREPHFSISMYDKDKVQYFKVDYDDFDFTEDNELIWSKILTAGKKGSDIIVFPEMLGNPDMESFITKRIQALSPQEQKKIPSLIVLPSFWKENRNTVSILDNHGTIVCRQGKQNPFRVEQDGTGYLEGINSSLVVNIFHYEGIGRMAILICKDFLTTKYMEQLMRCFKLTLIIVPSFSTGSYDFRQSSDLCAHDDCNVVWINTCAAMEKGKEANFENIGYVRKRTSRNDDEAQRLSKMPACSGAFTNSCPHDCLFYETIKGV